jgi:hypothetical protein
LSTSKISLILFDSVVRDSAGVAQLVEQRIRNAKVGSSTLFTGTNLKSRLDVQAAFSLGAAKA